MSASVQARLRGALSRCLEERLRKHRRPTAQKIVSYIQKTVSYNRRTGPSKTPSSPALYCAPVRSLPELEGSSKKHRRCAAEGRAGKGTASQPGSVRRLDERRRRCGRHAQQAPPRGGEHAADRGAGRATFALSASCCLTPTPCPLSFSAQGRGFRAQRRCGGQVAPGGGSVENEARAGAAVCPLLVCAFVCLLAHVHASAPLSFRTDAVAAKAFVEQFKEHLSDDAALRRALAPTLSVRTLSRRGAGTRA